MNHLLKGAALTALIVLGVTAMAIEEPKYKIISEEGAFQIRHYPPVLIAETFVDGDMDEASNKGFRLIADFIFGNNTVPNSPTNGSGKIAMTAPVTVQPVSTKIAMTAPVTVEPILHASEKITEANRWRVQFSMPSNYSLETLPKPNNNGVQVRETPAATYAVLTYSGFNFFSSIQNHTEELRSWMQSKKLEAIKPAQLARYNPPWTLPMWRRNEIMVEIKTNACCATP